MTKRSPNGKVEVEEPVWEDIGTSEESPDEAGQHPALELWRHPGLGDLVQGDRGEKYLPLLFLIEKANIPGRMVDVYSRALYFTIKYNSTSMALRMLSDLVVRLGTDGESRKEYLRVLAVMTEEDMRLKELEAREEILTKDRG